MSDNGTVGRDARRLGAQPRRTCWWCRTGIRTRGTSREDWGLRIRRRSGQHLAGYAAALAQNSLPSAIEPAQHGGLMVMVSNCAEDDARRDCDESANTR